MLAISRALLLNPRLLVMDEPTEGLAPGHRRPGRGDAGRGSARRATSPCSSSSRTSASRPRSPSAVAIMVNGRINRIIDVRRARRRPRAAAAPARRRPARPRGRRVDAEPAAAARPEAAPRRAARRPGAHLRLEPGRSRRAGRSPCRSRGSRRRRARARPAALAASSRRAGARRSAAARRRGGAPVVIVAGTLDTKGEELRFIRDLLNEAGLADAPRRPLDQRQAVRRRRRRRTRSRSITARGASGVFTGDRGAAVAGMAEAFERWIGAQSGVAGIISAGGSGGTAHRDAGDAGAAGRRAEGHDLDRRLRRRRPLCRPGRHHDDVLGHRRPGPQLDLAPGARQRRARAWPAWSKARAGRRAATPARRRARRRTCRRRPHHVRRHDALRAAGRRARSTDECDCLVFHATGIGGRSMEKLVEFGPARGRHRPHHDRGLRHPDGRRLPRDRGPLRRDDPRAHALCRLLRRARHGQFRPARHGAGALPRPPLLPAQPAGHADAHDAGGERPHGRAGSASA